MGGCEQGGITSGAREERKGDATCDVRANLEMDFRGEEGAPRGSKELTCGEEVSGSGREEGVGGRKRAVNSTKKGVKDEAGVRAITSHMGGGLTPQDTIYTPTNITVHVGRV